MNGENSTHMYCFGANQSKKRFRTNQPVNLGNSKEGKLSTMALSGGVSISAPHSFNLERDRQFSRHLATSFAFYLKLERENPVEVQVGLTNGGKRPEVWISTNVNAANKALESFDDMKVSEVRKLLLERLNPIIRDRSETDKSGISNRTLRHIQKFFYSLNSSNYNQFFHYILRLVKPENYQFTNGQHAERILIDFLGNRLVRIAGIRRPCAHCLQYLLDHPNRSSRMKLLLGPGPEYPSKNASTDNNGYEISPCNMVTTVTLNRENKYTVDYDSDSDSDPEEGPSENTELDRQLGRKTWHKADDYGPQKKRPRLDH